MNRPSCESGTFVANSYTGELHPVDQEVVRLTLKFKKLLDIGNEFCKHTTPYWTARQQTIIYLMLSGY